MLAVKAKYDGKVFIPMEPVQLKPASEVTVVIQEAELKKESGDIAYGSSAYRNWKPLPEEERLKTAYQEFKEAFPDEEPDMELLKLVGAAPPTRIEDDKQILMDAIWEKYHGADSD